MGVAFTVAALLFGAVLIAIVAAPTMVIYWAFDASGPWFLALDVVLTVGILSLPVFAAFLGD